MVDAITTPPAVTIPASPVQTSGLGGGGTGADFQTFLTMLTTQLQNQDPLNPMESTDFAVQLATFSGVEQQALTNRYLEQMAGETGGDAIAGWIGKEARTTAPLQLGDQPLTLDIQPHAQADSVQLVTRDAAGREVTREEIGPGAGQIDWMGRTAEGTRLPDGAYSFTLESRRAGEMIDEVQVGAYARIVEAQFNAEGGRLVFEGGTSALAREITALRDPA